LVALSYALFLILTTTLSLSASRLVLVVLAVFPAAGMVALRALHLRTREWKFAWAIGVAIILTQLAAALHYWPVTPIQYGLLLLGPLYALTELALNLGEDISPRRAGIEATIELFAFWMAAFLLRG
jgi:hypothetical protein